MFNSFLLRIVERLILIFLHYTRFWVVYPDLLSSQIASVSGSSTSESEDDAVQPNPREQPGGVTNNHSSSILMETLGLVRWWSCSRSCEWNERCRHGYRIINPLGEQRLLPIPSDLTKSSNVDEIVEIDVKSKCLSLGSKFTKKNNSVNLTKPSVDYELTTSQL